MEKNEYEEKALENLLQYTFSIAGKQMADELEEPEEEHIFSKEHERKMQKLFDNERKKLRKQIIYKNMKKVTVFLVLVMAVLSVSIFNVEAWRLEFLNLVMDIKETHTNIKFDKINLNSNSYSSDEVRLQYIPNGFLLENRRKAENKLYLKFINANDKYFNYSHRSIEHDFSIDTENTKGEKLNVNEQEAFYCVRNGTNELIFYDEINIFTIEGNINKNELVKIAENVEIQKY